jgi:hypothetical protein
MIDSPVLPKITRARGPQRREPITSRSTSSDRSSSASAGRPLVAVVFAVAPSWLAAAAARPRSERSVWAISGRSARLSPPNMPVQSTEGVRSSTTQQT